MVQPAVPHGRVALQVAHKTDPGLDPDKQVNEDACAYAEVAVGHLLVVCDGMGGHASGQEASQTAIRTIFREIEAPAASPGASLKHAIEVAGRAVYELGGPPHNRMRPGSTCVALLIHPGGIEVAHVGDSRAYMLRAGQLYPITRDHSMVQQMVDAGVLSPQDAVGHPDANKITRALGMTPEVEVELRPAPIPHAPGDIVLLASDGLCDLVPAEDIQAVVLQAMQVRGLSFACEQLVAMANARGGHDNITVLMAAVAEAPSAAAPRPTIPEAVASAAMPAQAMASPAMPAAALPPAAPANMPPAGVATPAPAATMPEMPTIPEGPPAGPAPTMIDEEFGPDPSAGIGPAGYQPGLASGSFQRPAARPAVPGLLIAGVALVFLGVLIALGFLLWAMSSGSNAPSDAGSTLRESPAPAVELTARQARVEVPVPLLQPTVRRVDP